MSVILEFFSSLLDGFELLTLAIIIGGLPFLIFVLRARHAAPAPPQVVRLALTAVAGAALALAAMQATQLFLKLLALSDAGSTLPLALFADTTVFRFSLVRLVTALLTAAATWSVLRRPGSGIRWALMSLVIATLLVNEAALSHAASRLEQAGLLMTVTVLHELGASIWAGGVLHLSALWLLARRQNDVRAFWPTALARFSPLAIVGMFLIVLPGLFLAWYYTETWGGLLGTGYGNMITVKVLLLVTVLVLAAYNYRAGRSWRTRHDSRPALTTAPALVEVEAGLVVALMMSAAALSSLPPAGDVGEELATPAEVWAMFSPKLPNLHGPEIYLIPAPELTDIETGETRMKEDVVWSNFTHNFSGALLLVMGVMALAERYRSVRWVRHWPLLFLGFAVFILVLADPQVWPVGRLGLIESLAEPEVLQHRLAAMVVIGLGVFEWRARIHKVPDPRVAYIFPLLCGVGGIVLLTHSHAVYELKQEFLIQSTHVAMGFLAVIMGAGRWLELRLAGPAARTAGLVSVWSMLLIGVILLFYLEPRVRA